MCEAECRCGERSKKRSLFIFFYSALQEGVNGWKEVQREWLVREESACIEAEFVRRRIHVLRQQHEELEKKVRRPRKKG